MKSWYKNWDVISPIFKFSAQVRKVIYTTNAIESLNSGYRRLNKQRSVFPSDTALLKALYLATHEIAKKWTMPLRNWGRVLGKLEIMYPDRLTAEETWQITVVIVYCKKRSGCFSSRSTTSFFITVGEFTENFSQGHLLPRISSACWKQSFSICRNFILSSILLKSFMNT